jgi:hypothetical protein
MVKLSSFLVADSVENYCTDYVDGENVAAVYDLAELEESLAFRQSVPADLMSLMRGWVQGFCPLNTIEQALSDLIDNRGFNKVERIVANITAEQAITMLGPEDTLVDCTGCKSLLRDYLAPGPATAPKTPIHLTSTLNMQLSSPSCMVSRIYATSIVNTTRMKRIFTINLFLQ